MKGNHSAVFSGGLITPMACPCLWFLLVVLANVVNSRVFCETLCSECLILLESVHCGNIRGKAYGVLPWVFRYACKFSLTFSLCYSKARNSTILGLGHPRVPLGIPGYLNFQGCAGNGLWQY